jgi:hypothetical protein
LAYLLFGRDKMLDVADISVSPLVYQDEHDGVKYEAICYPAGNPAGDWSLKNLRLPGDVESHPTEAERLGRTLAAHGIKRAYAPHVAASSARIVPKSMLTDVLELPHGVLLLRNAQLPADGVALGRGEAFIMSGGGCPVIVAAGDGMCIAAHASRESLLDRYFIMNGRMHAERKYKSVINAIVGWAARRETGILQPQKMHLRGYFTIPTHRFHHRKDDAKFGYVNSLTAEYVAKNWGPSIMPAPDYCLSISRLIEAQASVLQFGLKEVEEAIPEDGAFGYTRHPDEAMRPVRSLNIVHRIS